MKKRARLPRAPAGRLQSPSAPPGDPPAVRPPDLRPPWPVDPRPREPGSSHRALALSAGLCLGLVVSLWWFDTVLMPFVLGGVLAYFLKGTVDAIERRLRPVVGTGYGRLAAILALFALGTVAMFAAVLPIVITAASSALRLADQISMSDVTSYRKTALEVFERYRRMAHALPYADRVFDTLAQHKEEIVLTTGQWFQQIGQGAGHLVRNLVVATLAGGARALNLIFVPVALFYWLYDFESFARTFWELVPLSHQSWTRRVLARIDQVLTGFVRGQLCVAAAAGTIFTIGLRALSIPHALLLGPIAGAATVVPYMNAFVLVPAALLGLWQGGWNATGATLALGVAILYVAYQVLESLVLQPRLVGGAIALHPLVVLVSLPLGAEIAGLAGVLLAVPAAACLKILWEELRGAVYGPEAAFDSKPV